MKCGWCLTGDHGDCRQRILTRIEPETIIECDCKCRTTMESVGSASER